MAESIATTLLQATKNDLEFYFCFIGDAWIGKQGTSSRFLCLLQAQHRWKRRPGCMRAIPSCCQRDSASGEYAISRGNGGNSYICPITCHRLRAPYISYAISNDIPLSHRPYKSFFLNDTYFPLQILGIQK